MTSELAHIRVRDVMHVGLLTCAADAPLGEVAGIMAKHRVHAVAITDDAGGRAVGVVSAADVVAALAAHEEPSAREAAATEPLAVSAEESLDRAAQLLAEHGVSHLIVLDAADGHPIGVISTLDLAAVYAGEGGREALA
jgi:CBS domain-containing protein